MEENVNVIVLMNDLMKDYCACACESTYILISNIGYVNDSLSRCSSV